MEGFLYFRTRRDQESTKSFLAASCTVLAHLCSLVTRRRWQEAVVVHKQAVLEETVIWQRAYAVEGSGLTDPGELPEHPDEPIETDFTVKLPDFIYAFRLLRKRVIDRKVRSELLRASMLDEVLRTFEAEHFARTRAAARFAAGHDAELSRAEMEDSHEFRHVYECFFASYVQTGSSSLTSPRSSAFLAYVSSASLDDPFSAAGMDDYNVHVDLQEHAIDLEYGDTLETRVEYPDTACDDYAVGLLANEVTAGDQELEDGLGATHQAYFSFQSSRNYVNSLRKVRGLVPAQPT